MKTFRVFVVGFVSAVVMLAPILAAAAPIQGPVEYNDRVTFQPGSIANFTGQLQIKGVAVTNTAAEINATVYGYTHGGTNIPANIDSANLTNAFLTAGPSIGGNLAAGTLTNALSTGVVTTNTWLNAAGPGTNGVIVKQAIGGRYVILSVSP